MNNKSYRFAAVAAILLALCLVFMMPAAADDGSVAKIGNTEYATLQKAVDAAVTGNTIILLDNIEQADGVVITNKKLTIDLNDKTFNVTEGASTNNRTFKIDGDSEVTIKNGVMVAYGDYSSGAYGTIRTEGTAKVTLTDLKLYNYRGNGLNIKALSGTTVTISNTEIYSQYGGGIEAAGGIVELTNVKVEQKGMYTAPYNSMAISVNGGGKAIVHSGTYTTECITAEEANGQGSSHGPWAAGVLNSGGTLIINGGTFSNDNFGENSLATAARGLILADTGAVVEINGGTFNALKSIIDIQNNLGDASKNPKGTIKGGVFSADPTNSYVKIAECYVVNNNVDDGTYSVVIDPNTEAKIGDTYCKTLAEAVAAAKAGETVTLLKDVELGATLTIDKKLTLDLNGNALQYNSGSVVKADGVNADVTIVDSIGNGKITTTDSGAAALNIYNGAKATLDEGSLEAEKYAVAVGYGTLSGTFVMNGGSVKGNTYGVFCNNGSITMNDGTVSSNANAVVLVKGTFVMNGGTITGDSNAAVITNGGHDDTSIVINNGILTSNNGVALYHPNNGNLIINGGIFTGKTAVYFKSGSLSVSSINGGTLIGTGDQVEYTYVTSGCEATGDALVIENVGGGTGYEAITSVSITGGTFISEKANAVASYAATSVNPDAKPVTAFITGGTFSSNPSAYIASGYEVVQPGNQYLVQKYVDRSSSSSSSKPVEEPEEPVDPEVPVEPETPVDEPEAGEVTVETEVTDGGEVEFEAPVEEPGVEGGSAAADEDETKITGVVLPTGTEGKVEFVPVSEQPAPTGQEENTKKVFEINVPTYEKGKPATIKFTMTVAELAADGKEAEDVALWHFDEETGEWTKLVTSYVIVDGVVYFEAITEDFSPFAIIYEDEPADEPVEEPETPASPAPILAALAGLGVAFVLRRK